MVCGIRFPFSKHRVLFPSYLIPLLAQRIIMIARAIMIPVISNGIIYPSSSSSGSHRTTRVGTPSKSSGCRRVHSPSMKYSTLNIGHLLSSYNIYSTFQVKT